MLLLFMRFQLSRAEICFLSSALLVSQLGTQLMFCCQTLEFPESCKALIFLDISRVYFHRNPSRSGVHVLYARYYSPCGNN